jgi:ABC-2 type transport system permease protein
MEQDRKIGNIRAKSWSRFLITIAAIIIAAAALNLLRLRIDLTQDKRFTLSPVSNRVLDKIKNDIYIEVYLDGEMPIPLKRLRKSVKEMLDEFRIASGRHIDYEFTNPAETKDAGEREARYTELYNKGLNPINIRDLDDEGGSISKMIFPGMIINYNGIEVPVNFLKNNQGVSSEENILHSIEGLEYEIVQTLSTVTSDTIYKVAFLEGQGEWTEPEVADITLNLARYFTIDRGTIGGRQGVLDTYSAVIVAGPSKEFSEADKLVLDQYIMSGGKVAWLIDEVAVSSDSLANGETAGLYRPLNIEDQLFHYGVRVNPEIVQDIECAQIRISVMTGNDQKQIVPFLWPYYPLLMPNQNHPVTRNINRVRGEFANTIDTVGLDSAIKKTILLSTSAYSRTLSPPMFISLKEVEQMPDRSKFNMPSLPAAVLLEGVFPSAFRNRMAATLAGDQNFRLKTTSLRTKMIVIADGNIIRNDVSKSGLNETPLTLGQDRYTGEMYGNRDFLINCMNYLVDDNGLMELRSREMKLRLLDRARVKSHKTEIQLINISTPVLIVILAGLIYGFFRKKAYANR